MKLEILNMPNHLSPSSINEWKMCNAKFILKRLMGLPYPSYAQSQAAAVGTVFDAMVKEELAKRLGQIDERLTLGELLEDNLQVDDEETSYVIPIAERLFKGYVGSGMLDRLMDQGIARVELSRKITISDGEASIPFYVKPDAVMNNGAPVDWKVQGSVSKSGASPCQGYNYGMRDGIPMTPHKKNGEPLEALNEGWAVQLACYSWCYTNLLPWRELPVAIENVTVRNGRATFTSIRTTISVEFQQKLWRSITKIWSDIENKKFSPPVPESRKCFAYATRCEMADRCDAFQHWQGMQSDPTIAPLISR